MAKGDIQVFTQAKFDLGRKIHDLVNDEFKLALITGTTPTQTTSDPRWGPGGGEDLSLSEPTPGGSYVAGGNVVTNSWQIATKDVNFDVGDASWVQNASNPTAVTYAVLYNNTSVGKQCYAFIDLGGTFDMQTGPLDIVITLMNTMSSTTDI